MTSILDPMFNGMPASEMYRATVFPELFPMGKPMLVENWCREDQQMFCGGKYMTLMEAHLD